jgi:hypothetical protein
MSFTAKLSVGPVGEQKNGFSADMGIYTHSNTRKSTIYLAETGSYNLELFKYRHACNLKAKCR